MTESPPAAFSFKRDRTLPQTARRVYDYLSTTLDFTEVRAVKSDLECEQAGVSLPPFIAALNLLVERGYLIEHARDARQIRHFTLAWSIRTDRQRS
jgi:hypothetical protein